MTDTGALAQLAAVEAFTAWLKVDKRNYPQEDRLLGDSYEGAPVLRSDLEALIAATRSLAQIAAERTTALSDAREGVNTLGNAARAAEVQRDAWRAAFESLHARILRDLPGDGSELPQPDDAFWAAQLDGLVAFADELARQTEGAAGPGVPAAGHGTGRDGRRVMADLESLADRLAGTAANLQAYIEARADEIAGPVVSAAQAEHDERVSELGSQHAFEIQRKDDLIAELRRQLDAAVKSRDREFDELKRLRATVHRVRHQVRCWPNEDGKWFAFRDDLYAALDGDETKEN